MKQIKTLSILCFITVYINVEAQNLTAFSDYKNYFFGFDDGKITQLDYLPVQSFQVGGNAIAYIDNAINLKAFHKGKITTLFDGLIKEYKATDYLVAYVPAPGQTLNIFDNGEIYKLTKNLESYSVGDSLVAFYDALTRKFNVYYRNNITLLEDVMTQHPVKNFKTGDNVLAYVNYLNEFKLFYRGTVINITTINDSLTYKTGKNVVGYHNQKSGFKAFYNGTLYDLEVFNPKSFFVGDDMVAYIDANEHFKVFYDGEVKTLNSFEPTFYKVEDSLVVYGEANLFKVFYKGNIHTVENYIPSNFLIDFNSIAYLDQQGRLKMFNNGESKLITNNRVDQFELNRNVVSYIVNNQNYVYYNSKTYTHN